jgi:hypothetical protein
MAECVRQVDVPMMMMLLQNTGEKEDKGTEKNFALNILFSIFVCIHRFVLIF